MIDFEQTVLAWLSADDAIGAPIATRHQDDIRGGPWVVMHLLDERPLAGSPALNHATAYLQLDCYAGGNNSQADAQALSDAVRARLHALPAGMDGGVHSAIEGDGGVISAVTGLSRRRLPDTTMDPARERYVVEAQVHGHETRGAA